MGGMQMMAGFASVQLRKVEKPEEKKSVSNVQSAGNSQGNPQNCEKNQNLAHLSNIMVQGAIRKSKYLKVLKGNFIDFIRNYQ